MALNFPRKPDFPTSKVRRYLEPGPIVLVTSAHGGERDVMTLGWHVMIEFTPALVGCVIARGNHSHRLVRDSGECVINVPTAALTDTVVAVGNTSGADIDKFDAFGLATDPAAHVAAPLLRACPASFECRVHDDGFVGKYDFFVLEVVKAHVAASPRHPRTLHYTGDGVFMVAGKVVSRRSKFRPGML